VAFAIDTVNEIITSIPSFTSITRPTLLSFESLLRREHLEAYTYSTRRCLDAKRGSEA
jgi:hypothetical protein